MTSTESVSPKSAQLDARRPEEVLSILLDGQIGALASVGKAIDAIANAAELLADTIRGGGRIAYAAAGSSALMAMADGLELAGTFGISNDRVTILIAGGVASLTDMLGGTEDDLEQAARDVAKAGIGPGDCLIGVSASGSTPYTLAAVEAAGEAGASTIAIANNENAPLLAAATVGIFLATPPEVIAGSTRLGAATAQKAALNMMSTLMAVHLGHIYDGYMINLRADNQKLRNRAKNIVSEIGRCGLDESADFLGAAAGSVKTAVLLAAGAPDKDRAEELLATHGGRLRPALAALQ